VITPSTADQLRRIHSSEQMQAYVGARLHGDDQQAPPPLDRYHGIEDYEDILAALASHPQLTDDQRTWLWNAIIKTAEQAWDRGENEPFRRVVTLCWRLGRPPGGERYLSFLPRHPHGFGWEQPERVTIAAHALLWLLVWEAHPERTFWHDTVKAIAERAPDVEAKYLALGRAVDGTGTLAEDLWFTVLRTALESQRFPSATLRTVLVGQWQRAGGDPQAETRLLQSLGEALAQTRQLERVPEAHAASLFQLLEELTELPWSGNSQTATLDQILRENRPMPNVPDGGANPQASSHPMSPKAFQPWSLAA
jgi:hypothetical protein